MAKMGKKMYALIYHTEIIINKNQVAKTDINIFTVTRQISVG